MNQPEFEQRSPAALLAQSDRILHDWQGAYERALLYLEALGIDPAPRSRLALRAVERAVASPSWEAGGDAYAETLKELRRLVMETYPANGSAPGEPGESFEAWRLEAALAGRRPRDMPASVAPLRWGDLVRSMPPLSRESMAANTFVRGLLRRAIVRAGNAATGPGGDPSSAGAGAPDKRGVRARRREAAWPRVASRRRFLLALLVLIPSFIASQFMLEVLPYQGQSRLEIAIVLFFAALFGWISIGFWTALAGFFTLVRGKDRFAVTSLEEPAAGGADAAVRTAILMPVCEEPVERIFAGLKVISRSLERAGARRSFDFFILSDSADPAQWVKEEEGWLDWCREEDGFDRIFYRRRGVRVKRKSGNIADFCRRWGRNYRYMIVLDADSVMTGETIVRLVRLMEARPDAGIIQTLPVAVNRRSLFARFQQFAGRIYGPLFAAGLHYWQLGDGQFWGHNAIIRVAPFMEHCFLPKLPGKPPLGGEILSHDFVEAALMGRAGWTVWLAYDLPGSYEETPSTLLEEMRRDRRWCQGNLQHLKLVFAQGLVGAHRALFFHGALSYVSAFLWFGFLSLGTAFAVWEAVRGPQYFPPEPTLFPEWPIWRPDWALALAAVTAAILFLPKFLGVALVLLRRNAGHFGGVSRLGMSMALEILLSALLAPIRMMFHARFVVSTLLGRAVAWRSQAREDAETPWKEAFRRHGLDTIVATAWGLGAYRLSPVYFWWLTPIAGALILSIPLSVFASRVRAGDRARAWGLFLTPEEVAPPEELEDLQRELDPVKAARTDRRRIAGHDGFIRAVVDPYANALHGLLLRRPRSLTPSIRARREALWGRALAEGPESLSAAERRALLSDPEMVRALHHEVWRLSTKGPAKRWFGPGA
jgi:membrane glycosyltransferase